MKLHFLCDQAQKLKGILRRLENAATACLSSWSYSPARARGSNGNYRNCGRRLLPALRAGKLARLWRGRSPQKCWPPVAATES